MADQTKPRATPRPRGRPRAAARVGREWAILDAAMAMCLERMFRRASAD